jgi:hypothetical protein
MAAGPENTVRVTYDNGKISCDREWVNCFWEIPGREDIRWVFKGFPADIKYVGVSFLDFVPAKYRQGVPGFVNSPPFLGVGVVSGSAQAGLPDLETYGNLRKKGYFCYSLQFFDANMVQQYSLDPGGTSDPIPPGSEHP